MSNNPPGWYGDPFGRAQVRWWSGSGWTDHVATNGQEFIDPPGAGPVAAAPTAAAPAASAPAAPVAVVAAAPVAPVAAPRKPGTTMAIVAAVALVAGGLGGWLLRGDGGGSGGGGAAGGGASAGTLSTPVLQGLASLNSYEWRVTATSVGPTEADRTDLSANGASDSQADLRYSAMTQTSTSADDPEPSTSTTETWRSATSSCTFDGEEYTTDAANPFEADLGTVLSGVFDIVVPAGNAVLVGDEVVAGVAAKHWTFTIQGLAAGSGAQVEVNKGDVWVAADGGYLLKYQVETAMRSAPSDAAGAEVYRLTLTLEMTSVNQPVTVQMPAACPPPGTDGGISG